MTFKSINDTISFEISSENEDLINSFIEGFFKIFGFLETRKIEALQQNTSAINQQLIEHINQFKGKFPPVLNQVVAFFKKMVVNEYFFFLPNVEINTMAGMKLHAYLAAAKDGLNASKMDKINKNLEKLYGVLLDNYDMFPHGTVRKSIGQRIKSKRICRFCLKGEPEVTFVKAAHAISEALGNRKIFLNEECDSCNDKFSMEIEPDLVAYMSLFRSIYDVKGKGGSKKIKGTNFELENTGNVQLTFSSDADRPKENEPYSLTLNLQQKIISQDIYRCFCKFFISVVEKEYLENFSETIKWLNKKSSVIKLPPIAEAISYHNFTKEPQLYVYIRKNNDDRLPYAIGEFHFTCTIKVFIIPLSGKDNKDFLDKSDYTYFWTKFKHYKSVKWVYNDFSSENERDFSFSINVEVKEEKK